MPSYFQDLIRLWQLSKEPLVYQSMVKPVKMGNTLPIAYGGYVTALAVQAAFHSLPKEASDGSSSWAIYSANGLFLGPTSTESTVELTVTELRNTKSFSTRSILASQQINGVERKCFTAFIDFIHKGPPTLAPHKEAKLPLSYSIAPLKSYPHPNQLGDVYENAKQRFEEGKITQKDVESVNSVFGLGRKVSDTRMIKGDIFDETNFSITPRKDTDQQLAIPDVTQRRNVDYFKARDTLIPTKSMQLKDDSLILRADSIQASYLAFVLDGALSFYPLSEHGLALQDAGACSTLDFALRFHDDGYDLQDWHLREMRTYCADRERSFSESLIFNSRGKLVASTTQQCILRPKPSIKTAKL